LLEKPAFEKVMIHGMGLDEHGKKMSKSKGNVVLPLDMMDKYSADALRWWAASVKLGEDLNFKEEDLQAGIRHATKLWNTARFASMHLNGKPKKPKELNIIDRWLLAELNGVIERSTQSFEQYEYSKAKMLAEHFFWNIFCDYYIEMIKYRLYSGKEKDSALWTLYNSLLIQLKLFAPFIPFVTEELYQLLFKQYEKDKSIHLSNWPEPLTVPADDEVLKLGRIAVECIAALRKWKKLNNMSLAEEVETVTLAHPDVANAEKVRIEVEKTMRIKKLVLKEGREVIAE